MGKTPEHETIYLRIKDSILYGEVIPGQPLTIHGLADSIGAGVTPVREAIRRLTAEGALVVLENRRVAVPTMTEHRLAQIELVRLSIEPYLARLGAMTSGEQDVIELEQIDRRVNAAIEIGDIRSYLEANFQFHFKLYSAADADILFRLAESLWLQIGPSLRVVCGRFGTSKLRDHHRDVTDAMRDGDLAGVETAVANDLRQGFEFVRQTLTV